MFKGVPDSVIQTLYLWIESWKVCKVGYGYWGNGDMHLYAEQRGSESASRSSNVASAYECCPQVTDAIAEWMHKGYAFGPVNGDSASGSESQRHYGSAETEWFCESDFEFVNAKRQQFERLDKQRQFPGKNVIFQVAPSSGHSRLGLPAYKHSCVR
jgi:hypothetical protein